MFIKAVKKHNPGGHTTFTYHRLVESYRTSRGPRQITLLNLGTLQLPKSKWRDLARRIEQLASGQATIQPEDPEVETLARHYAPLLAQRRQQRQAQNNDEHPGEEPSGRWETVDLKSIQHKKVRAIGAEYVGWQYFRKLGMAEVLRGAGLEEQQVLVAGLLIIGRLVSPGSERATLQWARHLSGIGELMGLGVREVSESMVYRMTDRLWEHKEWIEQELRGQERELFELTERVVLYDLTNTYFEGAESGGELIRHGKSKDKRHDRPLITLGSVVDEWGFAKRSEFFPGAVDEPGTLQGMLGQLGARRGSTVVVDAGIATGENLGWLKSQGYEYICVARGKPLSPEQEQESEGVVRIRDNRSGLVEGRLVKGEEEWVVVCDSSSRRHKEQAMKGRFQRRYEEGLAEIKAALGKKGGTKRYEKVLERIGRLKERCHGIDRYYEVSLTREDDIMTDLQWKLTGGEDAHKRYSGRYYLRTSRRDLSEKEIWELYVTLGGIEDSFRSLKSELGMRPVYHWVERRIKAHIFITVLAYHLLNAIRHRLRAAGYGMRWSTVRERLSTHVLVSTTMRTEEGRMVYVRTPSTPELFHRDIYRALGLSASPIRRRNRVQ
jgi:transposase